MAFPGYRVRWFRCPHFRVQLGSSGAEHSFPCQRCKIVVARPGDYAQACDHRGPEDRSICHVHRGAFESKDDAWWIGTSCDEIGDLVPDDPSHAAEARRLGIEQVYRNEHYAVELCTMLAHDLAAVGELR